MNKPRYLTKSRYKLALDCPTKLYYTGKPEYPDAKIEDTFLESLAEGGYQVGELAKCYFPGGTDIKEQGYDIPLKRTRELLQHENVIIYEAAFQYKNLFIRTDILVKKGNEVELHEVKAKSFGGRDAGDMLDKKGCLQSGWTDYVYDVAFQKYVIAEAYPNWNVKAYLMLADKNKKATVDGINQKFQLVKGANGRTLVQVKGNLTKEDLGEKILTSIQVDEILDMIFAGTDSAREQERSFIENIHYLADNYENDGKIHTSIGKGCAGCEFKATEEQEKQGLKSGFKECWKKQLNWTDKAFLQPMIFNIWNFQNKAKLLEDGIYFIKDVEKEHIGDIRPKEDGSLSTKERQWIQVEKVQQRDTKPYVDTDGLKTQLESFTYPLHFIDFETSMVAIPFYKGRKPYEQVAFQFSHHLVQEDGSIEHAGQYLCTEVGKFPNFEFVRKLKEQLENDNGTIFRYHNHENTVLNQITAQLNQVTEADLPEKKQLLDFTRSITHSDTHTGERESV